MYTLFFLIIVICVYLISILPFIIKTRKGFTYHLVKPGLYLRGLICWAWLLFWCLVYYMIVKIEKIIHGKDADMYKYMKKSMIMFSKLPNLLFGIEIRYEGLENIPKDRQYLMFANHQTNWDNIYFGFPIPKRTFTMGKIELKKIPIYNFWFEAVGNIFINRQNKDKAVKAVNRYEEVVKNDDGICPFIFPEGTRNFFKKTKQLLLPFKKGPAHISLNCKLPILMCVAEPLYDLFGDRTGLGFFEKRIITFYYLPLLETSHLVKNRESINYITNTTYKLMLQKIKDVIKEKKIKLR